MRTDGQTDMTKLVVALHNSAKATKKKVVLMAFFQQELYKSFTITEIIFCLIRLGYSVSPYGLA